MRTPETRPNPYIAWLESTDAKLPPEILPSGRCSFAHKGMADATALYSGASDLRQTVKTMVPVAAAVGSAAPADGIIPAGFTYFGQLVSHDFSRRTEGVFTMDLLTDGLVPRQRKRINRARGDAGLMLDSVLGPIEAPADPPEIWRFPPPDPDFPMASVDLRRTHPENGRLIAPLPDTRNDDSPMLAQLAALFIAYVQRATRILQAQGSTEAPFWARLLTVRMFHRIIRQDYLPRMVLPALVQAYGRFDTSLIGLTAPHSAPHMPVELTNAVLRCGHWMIRPQYALNGTPEGRVRIAELLHGIADIETKRRTENPNFWRIDWRQFFPLEDSPTGIAPQMALAFGQGLTRLVGSSHSLPDSIRIPEHLVSTNDDFALRDLARSTCGGLMSVAALTDLLRPHLAQCFPDWTLWDQTARQRMVTAWCGQHMAAADIADHLILDPPLYLYSLIESGGSAPGEGNRHSLGALASVILAESLMARIAHCEGFLDPVPEACRSAVEGAAPITSMAALIRFLTLE